METNVTRLLEGSSRRIKTFKVDGSLESGDDCRIETKMIQQMFTQVMSSYYVRWGGTGLRVLKHRSTM